MFVAKLETERNILTSHVLLKDINTKNKFLERKNGD